MRNTSKNLRLRRAAQKRANKAAKALKQAKKAARKKKA
jgi:hypothetical protein